LEIEVKKRFPKVYVRRGDLDVIKSSLLYKKLRSDLTEKKINILVGTQLIIKEEILSHMNLVGIVIADGLLNLPDFRAGEYLFHLLNKIRRLMKPQGRLVIQTYNPTHYAIETLKEKKDNFYKIESRIRKDLGYPPYLHWVRILLEGRVKTKVEKVAETMRESLEKEKIEFLGPSSCPFAKIRGKYRYHMILKSENLSYIREILDKKLSPLFNGIQGIRGTVDVDPLQTM
jgi:primosomal protein N' (replication factor Y)